VFKRVRTGVVAGLLVFMATSSVGSAASASIGNAAQPVLTRTIAKPVLSASKAQLVEGDRFTLTATIRSPKKAARATLQKFRISVFGEPTWDAIKTVKAAHKRKVSFARVATGENSERYRVVVTYRKVKKPVVSKPVSVTVWRWIPLKEYRPYYEAEPYAAIFGTTTINGTAYSGWGAASYSHTGTWESRFTPGRHCKSFKAVLGVGDISADGSSATIAFTADDKPIYTSPTLTPGMSLPLTLSLAAPYRFGIQLTDTTPGGTTGRDAVESWPVLGEPAFLCTGV